MPVTAVPPAAPPPPPSPGGAGWPPPAPSGGGGQPAPVGGPPLHGGPPAKTGVLPSGQAHCASARRADIITSSAAWTSGRRDERRSSACASGAARHGRVVVAWVRGRGIAQRCIPRLPEGESRRLLLAGHLVDASATGAIMGKPVQAAPRHEQLSIVTIMCQAPGARRSPGRYARGCACFRYGRHHGQACVSWIYLIYGLR